MKVLWLAHNIGFPPKGGALQRNYNLIRELSRECQVHVLAFDQPITRPPNISVQDCIHALSRFCASVDWVPVISPTSVRSRLSLVMKGIISGEAYDFTWLKSLNMADKLGKLVRTISPDVVHVDALGLAQYRPLLGNAGTVLNHHDVESHKMSHRAERTVNPVLRAYLRLEASKLVDAEKRWGSQFDVNAVVSADEASALSANCPNLRIRVIPNGVDTKYFTPRPDPGNGTLLFCGSMDMHPNQEAMDYFLKKIWPRVVAQSPNVELYVVGRNPPEWLVRAGKADSRIRVTGFVEDVRPYFRKATLFICPIVSGGGTRLKILDSLAMGVPVVATTFAACGLSVEHGKHLLLADTDEKFADAIRYLLREPSLRVELAISGVKRVDEMYSWTVVGQALLDTYDLAIRTSGHGCRQG